MVLSDEKMRECARRLLLSRMRVLLNNGFYGLLLMHMKMALDEECETAATDGERIYFSPSFMEELSDNELDFVLMHEILHVALLHCMRRGEREGKLFNIACDIVVNSNILFANNMDKKSITLSKYGESMHTVPNGEEGYKHNAEEVYAMLLKKNGGAPDSGQEKGDGGKEKKGDGTKAHGFSDDHSKWKDCDADGSLREVWVKRVCDAAEAIEIQKAVTGRGTVPLFAKRLLKEMKEPQIDWRTILNDFVQEEVCDYTFSPPDRRFDQSPFFLPDFNDTDISVSDILFMIDTSGSMSDDMITAAYSEIKGAIDQFNGKLKGYLGFFDAEVIEPEEFKDEDEFEVITPVGGGGTDFDIIFKYIKENMAEKLPRSIIILTDGYAPFPDETAAMDIPVLWLLNNEDVTPPWGKIARIKVEA